MVPPSSDERPPILICEFPFRIRLQMLSNLTAKLLEDYADVVGELVLEVDGDRQRLQLHYYPDYQKDVP